MAIVKKAVAVFVILNLCVVFVGADFENTESAEDSVSRKIAKKTSVIVDDYTKYDGFRKAQVESDSRNDDILPIKNGGVSGNRDRKRHSRNLRRRRPQRLGRPDSQSRNRTARVEGVNRKRRYHTFLDADGQLRYSWIDCCNIPSPCPPYRRPRPRPTPRPRYGSYYRNWQGLIHGCNCNAIGSLGASCDIRTGQCQCKPHVTGLRCDKCEIGYWGHGKSSDGCKPCECGGAGGATGACDALTGRCACRPGVAGEKCDRCLTGFYGLGSSGCLPCPKCDSGHVCDHKTGQCVCPHLAAGVGCKDCRPGAWGLILGEGCKLCNCSSLGSENSQCDVKTGECACRRGFAGPRCDSCSHGHYGQRCRPCACHKPGTREDSCSEDLCYCDVDGQCPCKENVVGAKCNECSNGTFGLSFDNPSGCTQCFCFGRTSHCTQAGLTWGFIRLHSPRSLQIVTNPKPNPLSPAIGYLSITRDGHQSKNLYGDLTAIELNTTNVLTIIPETEGNVTIGANYDLPYPLYWELPQKFLGDRVTSYGGFLKFSSSSYGLSDELSRKVLDTYPLVQIHSHGVLILDYFEYYPPMEGEHHVRFHESLWRLRSPLPSSGRQHIDRKLLMVALQNIEHIYIRATEFASPSEAILQKTSMDTAISVAARSPLMAQGVEMCDCPSPYSATSCQQAAIGFWMEPRLHSSEAAGTIVIQLVGEARPCHCNGRSVTCDAYSGHCTNCSHNTQGKQCERCAEGFYGDPSNAAGCSPCPCPTSTHNYATSCSVQPNRVTCYCKSGYTGVTCASCAPGFWRSELSDECLACNCSTTGSTSSDCDVNNGQCPCRDDTTGRQCDQCKTPRHYLDDKGFCTACDNCSQTLMDTIELMTYELIHDTSHIKNGTLPKPWPILNNIKKTAKEMKKKVANVLSAIGFLDTLPVDAYLDYQRLGEELKITSEQMVNTWKKKADRAFKAKHDADIALDNIIAFRKRLEAKVTELEDFGRSEKHLNIHKAVKEARNLLRKIKDFNFENYLDNANDVFDKANLQSTVIYEYVYKIKDHINKIDKIESRLNVWHDKIDDVNRLKEDTWDTIDEVEASVKRHKIRLQNVIGKHNQINALNRDVVDMLSNDSIARSHMILDECIENILGIEASKPMLKNLTALIEEREGILYRINPEYRYKYLIPAQEYASDLAETARKYKNLFAKTRDGADLAVKASTAYRDIVNEIDTANRAAESAYDAANKAREATLQSVNGNTLLSRSMKYKEDSTVLLKKATKQLDRVNDMSAELEKSQQKVERIRVAIRGIAWKDKDLYVTTNSLSGISVSGNLAIANNKSDRVYENMRALYKEADMIHKDTLYKLKMKLLDLQNHGDDKIGAAEEQISLLRGNIKLGSELANSLTGAASLRETEAKLANSTLTKSLQDLKDKIARAKHAAEGIRVSMRTSHGYPESGCVRSYKLPYITPSTTTRIALTLSLNTLDPKDSTLFYLPSKTSGDNVKLELSDGRIKFSWNIGGHAAYVIHPHVLETYSDNTPDYTWYRIEADRVWNIGKVIVRKVISPSDQPSLRVASASNSSTAGHGILRIGGGTEGALAWIGGHSQGPGLAGCLHSIALDGNRIGLWNFQQQLPGAQCSGCTEGAEEVKEELNMFHFNGAGYSVLKRSGVHPYNKNQFSISLSFRTYDEDALLFMALDQKNNRSVSVLLRSCKVIFRVEYGNIDNDGGGVLEMVAAGRYCTGKPVLVQAARAFVKRKLEKGSLRVNEEETLGSPNPPIITSQSLPDLTDSMYWIGGAPPGGSSTSRIPVAPSLLGCLGDLLIDQEGYNPLDTAQHNGIESGCAERVSTSVGFLGDGYLELPSQSLRRKSSFGLVFRTISDNALLVFSVPRKYQSQRANEVVPDYGYTTERESNDLEDEELVGGDDDVYYSLALVEGQAVVLINTGRGSLKLSSNTTALNNGHFHAVSVVKNGRKIDLYVDDGLEASGSLPQGSEFYLVTSGAGLYLGGLPLSLNRTDVAEERVGSNQPLYGAIKDLVIDNRLISMDNSLSSNRALIGRLGPSMGKLEEGEGANLLSTQEATQPETTTVPQGCQKVASYTLEPGAVKFGDMANSYAQVLITGRNIWQREMFMEFDFRTFYPNGLLFVVPGTKEKQKHLVAVYLRNGKLTLLLKARRRREVSLPILVNDGQWHRAVLRVLLKSGQRRLSLALVGLPQSSGASVLNAPASGSRPVFTRMPRRLLLANLLYVGGLPDKDSIPNMPDQIWKLEGLKGCMRRLTVNGRPEDLVRDAALHHNVGQCFPAIERGAYFAGDAHAIWSNHFAVGQQLELHIEFRTSEPSGLLLSAAGAPGILFGGEATDAHMSLEIHEGKIVMTVVSVEGRRLRVITKDSPSEASLCDNRWHSVSALYSSAGLTLRIDKRLEQNVLEGGDSGSGYSATTPPSLNEPPPFQPLYIGGLPDGAPIGTLISKESFKGCIRNISIRGHRKDWTDMDYLHNVLLSSCPVVQ